MTDFNLELGDFFLRYIDGLHHLGAELSYFVIAALSFILSCGHLFRNFFIFLFIGCQTAHLDLEVRLLRLRLLRLLRSLNLLKGLSILEHILVAEGGSRLRLNFL